MVKKRRDKRVWFVALGVFVAVFLFSFLIQKFKNMSENVEAANLANFDPGYIISDYQMGNYNSMNEAQIQAFLKSKNHCNDRDFSKAGRLVGYLSESSPYTWHVVDGHFVCMADENFNGESAAHIIYRAAQDYRINPQVLLVLLQKEQGLVTDTYPNSIQYRSAMGYGCPDTAACSSEYYGFKNQVRKAASLFRTVLDGGWSNYPVGSNYIQYAPNAACGGSWVNIRNRATSALYRYTPYQPNAGALAAGYGTAHCGAYGNRNFYLYFEDWFGGITQNQVNYKIPDGLYYIQVAKTKDMVIDVYDGSNTNGANIQLHEANYTSAQKWNIKYNTNTDDYTITNHISGKVLDVQGAGIESGTNVQLWEPNMTCAQRWKFVRILNDEIKMLSSCSYKALDVYSGIIKNGTNIQIWEDNGTDAQKWKFVPVETAVDGLYTISSALDNEKVIDIQGGSYNAKNATNIQLWDKNYTAAQRWQIKMGSDGYYTIENLQSGKVFDVAGGGSGNGVNIQTWENNGTCAQKWRILKIGDEYTFISACSVKTIDLRGANTRTGTNVQIYEANNSKAQKWRLTPVEKIKDGQYVIYSKLSDKKVIDVAGNNDNNGANVQIHDFNNTPTQLWSIKYNERNDTYSVYNDGTDKALDVMGAGKTLGVNVQIWEDNGTCAQRWSIAKVGDAYEFYSTCSGLLLDVEAAQIRNGANIQLYTPNGTNAQRWILR